MNHFWRIFAQSKIGTPEELNLPNQAANMGDLAQLLNVVYYIAGIIAVIVIIIAGINYVTADGNANKLTTAKNMIKYTAVGLILIILAFTITNTVLRGVTQ